MFFCRRGVFSAGAVAALLTSALAGPAVAPKDNGPRGAAIDLTEPPMVTTVIDTITTVVPCSTSTEITETSYETNCGCTKTNTYRWTPSASSHKHHSTTATCPVATNPSTVTVTTTATGFSNATSTTTATITSTVLSNYTTTATITSTAISNYTTTTTVRTTGFSNITITATSTSTSTVTVTSNATSTCPSSSAAPLTCDKYGYLIQHATLIRVDLATGGTTTVATSAGSGAGANAMGYNPIDNYLYANQNGDVVRIHADGTADTISTLPSAATGVFVGDIDQSGYYWISNGGDDWFQVDLRPLSSSFGNVLASGTIAAPVQVADWVFFPSAPAYLYSLGHVDGVITLVRWSLSTHAFSSVKSYPNLPVHTYGAMYGLNNGTLYASDNSAGTIWGVPISGGTPWVASHGPATSANDGARCVWNLNI